MPGVYWFDAKGAWRVNYRVDGVAKFKYFRPDLDDDLDARARASEEAVRFLQAHS